MTFFPPRAMAARRDFVAGFCSRPRRLRWPKSKSTCISPRPLLALTGYVLSLIFTAVACSTMLWRPDGEKNVFKRRWHVVDLSSDHFEKIGGFAAEAHQRHGRRRGQRAKEQNRIRKTKTNREIRTPKENGATKDGNEKPKELREVRASTFYRASQTGLAHPAQAVRGLRAPA